MKLLRCVLCAMLEIPSVALAGNAQMIQCHDLKGSTVEYGVPEQVRFKHLMTGGDHAGAAQAPTFQYVPAYANGFPGGINFLIHPVSRAVTVMWQLSPVLQEANRTAKPGEPRDQAPAPFTAKIVTYRPDEAIAATAEGHGGVVTTFTLFPKLHSVFITRTSYVSGNEPGAMVTTVRGACDFSL